jgi:hypothetical protein
VQKFWARPPHWDEKLPAWQSMATNELPVYEVETEDGIPVSLPSGAVYYVLTSHEEHYLLDKIERYLTDNHFVNVSDVQDIDRMIVFELLIHRWTLWLSKGRDYFNEDINIKQYSEMAHGYSTEVRQLKKSLGVDKSTRDRTRGDDSVAALWDNLARRAKEFGYKRNEEAVAAITAMQRIKAMLQFHANCDETERKENRCETADVLEVINDEVSKFDAIDEAFRHNVQTYWVRDQ